MFKLVLVAMLSSLLLGGGGASGCREKQNGNRQTEKPSPPPIAKQTHVAGELKVLAEGFHSSIDKPFIAVIRDPDTYSALRKLDANLPNLDSSFFDSNAVVAAFLGQRNTGGYGVEISREGEGGIRVVERKPGKGMMVPQIITAPFKIVSVEGGANAAIALSLDVAWKTGTQIYRITSGTFTSGGGFSGRTDNFRLEGEVRVVRADRLITLALDIRSSNSEKKRSLTEFATGLARDGEISIQTLSAGMLVDNPKPGLQASGTVAEKKLSLQIGSRPTTVADGYTGSGKLEAEASATRTPKM